MENFDNNELEVAEKIDDSHKEPSAVQTPVVDGVPIVSKGLSAKLTEYGQESARNADSMAELKQGVVLAVLEELGTTPTYDQMYSDVGIRARIVEGITEHYISKNMSQEVIEKNAFCQATIENVASGFMTYLYDECGVTQPVSEQPDATRKRSETNKAKEAFIEEWDSDVGALDQEIKGLNEKQVNLVSGSDDYKANKKEISRLERIKSEGIKDVNKSIKDDNSTLKKYSEKAFSVCKTVATPEQGKQLSSDDSKKHRIIATNMHLLQQFLKGEIKDFSFENRNGVIVTRVNSCEIGLHAVEKEEVNIAE